MKTLRKRFLAAVVCLAMAVTALPFGGAGTILAAGTTEAAEYEIYPTPHEITYQDGEFQISDSINIVYESGIDDVTKTRMSEVLALQGITGTASAAAQSGKTNFLIGIYGSDEYVDQYVKDNYSSIDTTVFANYGGHYVIAAEDEIVVLGADTDAAFYGITSLKHIFNQIENKTIRNLTIKDYADTNIRGFIEGYYGIPWSNEDRMSLMKFGGDFKMTSYIFAPKDDPYHTSKWRELYPEEEINAIKEMVEVGNSVKCRFVWTAHPFMGGFNASDVEGETASLLAKFEQLYSVGVRQFGVLGDDVGSLDRNAVIQVMTAVSDWAKAKGDVYDTVFCPAGYNHSWQGSYAELNDYDANFPDDVQIFWTGEAVCQPVEQKTLDHFKRYNTTSGEDRRSPLFWLNWPVNDINGQRLMMGKGSLLQTDITITDLAGVVTNPMQEAEASKVAIFAVADYAWNVKDFDDDQSWADSFDYIDADASEELHTLAKHMSNPQPNGHGLVLAESEELQPMISEFKTALASSESITEIGTSLAAEMDVIIDACDGFQAKSKNENLKEELLPFTGSLKDLATAIKNYIQAAIALENEENSDAVSYFMNGNSAYTDSKTHVRKGLSSNFYAQPGSTHLVPLAETIESAISDEINAYAFNTDDSEPAATLTASTNLTGFYEGTVANIIDGDTGTHAWYNGYEAAGQYYQVNISRPVTVYGIDVLNGSSASGKGQDTFGNAKLQYTTDGSTWLDVNGDIYSNYQEHVIVNDIELQNVVGVRYICTSVGTGNKWPSMREFTLILEKEASGQVYTNVEAYRELPASYGIDTNSIDAASGITLASGEYIGLKLDRIHEIDEVTCDITTDKLTLQTSENSHEWNSPDETGYIGNARYIRLINKTDTAITFDITDFTVTTSELYGKSLYAHNYSTVSDEAALFDGDWTTNCQFQGSQIVGTYFIYDLGAEIELDSFKVVCTDSEWDYPRHAKFSVSTDGTTWEDIMYLGNQDSDNDGEAANEDEIGDVLTNHEISYNTEKVSDLNKKARYLKFEITRTKVGADKWIRFQELEINDGAYMPTENNPTYEGPGESFDTKYSYMTDKNLATMYVPTKADSELIYHISEEESLNTVKIIQRGNSGAAVSVRTLSSPDTWKELGTLDDTICVLSAGNDTILDVKITWEENIPNIVDILVSSEEVTEPTEPDKTALQNAVAEAEKKQEAEYTEDSWSDFSKALADAKAVLADKNATEKSIADALSALTEAEKALVPAEDEPEPTVELPYTDVSEGDWFYDYVYDVYVKKLMTGLEDTVFGPGQNLARAQFAIILYRMEGEPKIEYTAQFPDVENNIWYTNAVLWAAKNGIVTGYSDTGKFGPSDNITREQMATMMYRYAKYKEMDVTDAKDLSSFPDGDKVQVFAVDGMKWCTAKGIISGKGEEPKILEPQGNTSRAECATIISRFTEITE